ncbi:hypothetical protein BVY04_04825 [bacterium M21]|nr:hypothetical protein BVY04_04825 [bacterium M21]
MAKKKCKNQGSHEADISTFKQIFIDHWEPFKSTNPRYDTTYYDDVITKMIDCGNPEKMGYAGWRCLGCGEYKTVAMTCKSTFCLSCAVPYTDHWMEFISRRLIPGVTYRHLVLTTPKHLRIYFYRNRELLSPFMKLAHPLLLDVFTTAFNVELDIGLVVVLQTFGRPGNYNVHLHILFSSGGITPDGTWKPISFIPYELVRKKWQYYLLTFLRQEAPPSVSLNKDIDKAWHNNPKGFVINIQKGDVPPGGKGLAKYLAKYLVSPPIALRRITAYDGESVSYWYKDHKTKAKEHETVPVLTFIGRMVQHILPKGFQRIRYYGFHSNVRYAAMRDEITRIQPPAKLLNDANSYRILPRKSFQELAITTLGNDPLKCPNCGQQMLLERIWHPTYGIIVDYAHSYETYQDTG